MISKYDNNKQGMIDLDEFASILMEVMKKKELSNRPIKNYLKSVFQKLASTSYLTTLTWPIRL